MYQRRRSFAVVPYGRRTYRRRSFKRRYPMYRKPASSAGGAAFASKVRSVVSAERKFLHFSATYLVEEQSTSTILMSSMPQGVAQGQRIGNWIQPTSTHGTLTVTGNPTAGESSIWNVRVFVLIFNDSSKGINTIGSTFLQDPSRPGGPFNIDRKGEFSVLWTRFFTISNNNDSALFTRTLTWRLSLQNKKKVLYDGATEDDLTKNHLFFYAVSDCPSPVNNPPTITVDATFRYTDS